MSKQLTITSSPHFRAKDSTQSVMRDVLIALVPALVASVVIFGVRALALAVVCMGFSMLFEYGYRKLMHLADTTADLSACVTGLLLAMNLPVLLPFWMAVIGCFVSIVVVKQMFGGIGKNFVNPAIVGRIVLFISFSVPMGTWLLPKNSVTPDVVTGATPLALGEGAALPSYMEMLLGQIGGSMGEVCKLALIIGGIYLVARKVMSPVAPLSFLATVFLMAALLGQDPVRHLLTGGLVLGAIFMATDYVTTPTSEMGKLIFGVGCGLITIVIRVYGSYPEGVSFAILLMNIFTPHIDRLLEKSAPVKAFGGAKL